ncbi:MAG: protein TolQ [Desulfobacteraceae bacterium]|nr:protein TolQ [Desulfobacteraceae bacterium]
MQQLDIINMFLKASLIVKLVMMMLVCFSLTSWFIVFNKFLLYRSTRQESAEFLDDFWKSRNLAEAYKSARESYSCPEANIFSTGFTELQKLSRIQKPGEETLEMRLANMDNLKRALDKAQNIEVHRLGKSLAFLATTGSATPFIGLFGTVWGIMSSFKDIGMRGSASLAVVAPGISEALVATAAGLAVAIPAVVFYNHFSNRLEGLENEMSRFISDFLNLVERDIITRRPEMKR